MSSSPRSTVLRGHAAAAVVAYERTPLAAAGPATAGPDQTRPRVRLDDVYATEIDRIKEQAHTEGFENGYAAGMAAAAEAVAAVEEAAAERMRAAEAARADQMTSAAAALTAAVQRLDAQAAPALDALADLIASGAFDLLVDLLGRELAVADQPGQDAIRRALALCPTDAPVLVRVNPHDYAALTSAFLAQLPATVTVQPDPTVEPSGAVADAGARRVDAQISAALDRVRAVLAPTAQAVPGSVAA